MDCAVSTLSDTEASEPEKKRSRWKRGLVVEGFDPPDKKTWYPRRPGDREYNKKPRYCEAERFPVSNSRLGRHLWSPVLYGTLERAAMRSVHRGDWPRALALLVALFKKAFAKSRTFKPVYEIFPLDSRFPIVDLFTRTLSNIPGGQPVLDSLFESLLTDQDLANATTNCLFYHLLKAVKLVSEGNTEEAQVVMDTLKQQPTYRKGLAKPAAVQLRACLQYGFWTASLEKDASSSGRGGIAMAMGDTEEMSSVSVLAAQGIWSLLGRKQSVHGDIRCLFILCHVMIWLGYVDDLSSVLSDAVAELGHHNDIHVLRSAVFSTQSSEESAKDSLVSLLEENPHEENALPLLLNTRKSDSATLDVSVEYIKGLLRHLDVCHPEQKPVKYCQKQWSEFLSLLKNPAEEEEFQVLREGVERRVNWWRRYYFSRFAVRSMMRIPGQKKMSRLFCTLGRVACYILHGEGPFLDDVMPHLKRRQKKKLQKTREAIRMCPSLKVF